MFLYKGTKKQTTVLYLYKIFLLKLYFNIQQKLTVRLLALLRLQFQKTSIVAEGGGQEFASGRFKSENCHGRYGLFFWNIMPYASASKQNFDSSLTSWWPSDGVYLIIGPIKRLMHKILTTMTTMITMTTLTRLKIMFLSFYYSCFVYCTITWVTMTLIGQIK